MAYRTDQNELAKHTLNGLQSRLERIQLVLYGDEEIDTSNDDRSSNIIARVASLESSLASLEARSKPVQTLLQLQRQQHQQQNKTSTSDTSDEESRVMATIVASHARQLTTLASQLRNVDDTAVANPVGLVTAITQLPRMEKVWQKAEMQREDIAALCGDSMALVARWHRIGVLGVGEVMVDWDERMKKIDIELKQRQARFNEDQLQL